MELSIDEIKRRLQSKGFAEDELKTLFKDDDELRKFYADSLKIHKYGNDTAASDPEEKYKLNKSEERDLKELEKRKKVKAKKVAKAIVPSAPKEQQAFEAAGQHLGPEAGKPIDLQRLLKQINDEEDED